VVMYFLMNPHLSSSFGLDFLQSVLTRLMPESNN